MGKPDARYGAPPDRPIHNRQETTLGIETSKYQEEKKENSIPSVAASESGRAQTTLSGVRDHISISRHKENYLEW